MRPQNVGRMGGGGWWRRTRSGGFTLIEMLLVLVIVASLAALVVPRFAKRSEQAKTVTAAANISSIELAIDAFEIDCGRYPTSEEGLRALLQQPANANGWQGPYLKKGLPVDPWGNAYVYRYPGQHLLDGYDMYSFGPDGQDGSADDICNWIQ